MTTGSFCQYFSKNVVHSSGAKGSSACISGISFIDPFRIFLLDSTQGYSSVSRSQSHVITSTADIQVRHSHRSCETLTGCTHITQTFKQPFGRRCELCRENTRSTPYPAATARRGDKVTAPISLAGFSCNFHVNSLSCPRLAKGLALS